MTAGAESHASEAEASVEVPAPVRSPWLRLLWWLLATVLLVLAGAVVWGIWQIDAARRSAERLAAQAIETRLQAESEALRLAAEREQLRTEREQLLQRLEQSERERRALQAERDTALAAVAVGQSQATVERAANERLASQLRALEAEGARLQADLRYLESLLPADGSAGSITIRGAQFVPDGVPRIWRYRALLMQGGRTERLFEGSVQLVVTGQQGSKEVTLVWPRKSEPESLQAMAVRFTRTLRIEGTVELPEGLKVKSAQLRVLEKGAVRAQQRAAL